MAPRSLHVGVAVVAVLLLAAALRSAAREDTISDTENVKSTLDNRYYRVHTEDDDHDPERAANTLAVLNRRALGLIGWLGRRYPTKSSAQGVVTDRIATRYRAESLVENSPDDPAGDTSYTLNKGQTIAMCLRQEDGRHHDLGLLTFVFFHELAHLGAVADDHPPEFWAVFRFLLDEAAAAGIYTSEDYGARPVPYCGYMVNYSPRHDPGLPRLEDVVRAHKNEDFLAEITSRPVAAARNTPLHR